MSPPPPTETDDVLELRRLSEHLVKDRRLARDDVAVVEGRDEPNRALLGEFEGVRLRVVIGRTELNELDVVGRKLLHLGDRRVLGHDDGRTHAEELRGVRDAQTVVTRGRGDHRAVGIVPVGCVDGRERTAYLETAR